jgi:hypothetical protein
MLRDNFEAQHYLVLPQLIEPSLLRWVSLRLQKTEFYLRVYEGLGRDLCPDEVHSMSLLNFLCNNRLIFETIEAITGCGRLGCFVGKIYRMEPNGDHFDTWHSDFLEDRKIGLTINLSEEAFDGGSLEIRDRNSEQILSRVTRTGFGDGVIFRIADYLEHRRTPVEGRFAKTAFAGWFKSRPDLTEILKDLRNESGRKTPD